MDNDAVAKRFGWEFWSGATVFVLGLIGLALVPSQVLEPTFGSRSIAFAPEAFPNITLALLAVLGAIMAVRAALGAVEESDDELPDGPPSVRVIVPMIIMVFYVALIPYLGAYVTTTLAILALFLDFGSRNWLSMLMVALSVPLLVWLFFRLTMKILLPTGTLLEGLL